LDDDQCRIGQWVKKGVFWNNHMLWKPDDMHIYLAPLRGHDGEYAFCLFKGNILCGGSIEALLKGIHNGIYSLMTLADLTQNHTKNRYFLQPEVPQYLYTRNFTSMEHTHLERFLNAMADLTMPEEIGFNLDEQKRNIGVFFELGTVDFEMYDDGEMSMMKRKGANNRNVTKEMFYEKLSNLHRKFQQIDTWLFQKCPCKNNPNCKRCAVTGKFGTIPSDIPDYMQEMERARIQELMQAIRGNKFYATLLQYSEDPAYKDQPLPRDVLEQLLRDNTNWLEFIFEDEAKDAQKE
jgi:hypothetical protein